MNNVVVGEGDGAAGACCLLFLTHTSSTTTTTTTSTSTTIITIKTTTSTDEEGSQAGAATEKTAISVVCGLTVAGCGCTRIHHTRGKDGAGRGRGQQPESGESR